MDKVIQEIKTAFADTPYPSDSNIGTFELDISFRGLHWKNVSWELLFYHRDAITSFTPEGFRLYLPAILLGILLHHKEVDTLTETLIANLVPLKEDDPAYSYWGVKLNRIVELMSTNEKRAVYKFLLKYLDLYPTDDWGYGEKGKSNLIAASQFWATVSE